MTVLLLSAALVLADPVEEAESVSLDDAKKLSNLHFDWHSYFVRRTLLPEYSDMGSKVIRYCESKGPVYAEYAVIFELNEKGFVERLYFETPEYQLNCVKQQMKRMSFTEPPIAPFYLHVHQF
ncbi:hypothetical protein QWI17_18765 [Gilvimarinus sp. SDUM040013]|uniref:Uncharacterized protein n=1 Tax=Gilvimarinus gilvus TaxID=3058038 RepID=A0ABU4RV50_9GAMM|nr:hypothetical protein [Gilvimarinus sp. SDUM040013]MDO3387894.1 hypothetical protein [Gilvimarinus sp. SDUM040013]MDX6848735.1 hypothetical protein [Gilvimarinus sp. SDUM040013]